jgi:magnesium-protoporphyrin O-methyltransferase
MMRPHRLGRGRNVRCGLTWAYPQGVPGSQEPCNCGCPNTFTSREAEGDLKRYRKKGADPTTRALIDAIVAEGVDGATLLDIGGGIGAIQLELLAAGAARATSVDASEAYVEAARSEAERRGFADRTSGRFGDFVALAPEIDPADIVTLDRVVCCYSDLPALLQAASDRARRLIGLVYPRDASWNRVAARVMNAVGWVTRNHTRWYLHTPGQVDAILRAAGYEGSEIKRNLIWQVVVYRRTAPQVA